jgi:hypothetical protein
VSELGAKPLSSANFAQTTLEANKVVSLIVVTNELARFPGMAATLRIGNEAYSVSMSFGPDWMHNSGP